MRGTRLLSCFGAHKLVCVGGLLFRGFGFSNGRPDSRAGVWLCRRRSCVRQFVQSNRGGAGGNLAEEILHQANTCFRVVTLECSAQA